MVRLFVLPVETVTKDYHSSKFTSARFTEHNSVPIIVYGQDDSAIIKRYFPDGPTSELSPVSPGGSTLLGQLVFFGYHLFFFSWGCSQRIKNKFKKVGGAAERMF